MSERYRIITMLGTVYEIDEDGCFLRYNNSMWKHPHEDWKCTGIAEVRPFGRLFFINLADFIKLIENDTKFTFKNGNPKYTLTDIDYGSERTHGNIKCHGIRYAIKL